MNAFMYLIKQAWLSLRLRTGFIFSVVMTMGITLGALLCVLTLAYVMLFKPLPIADQERLYNVEHYLLDEQRNKDGNAFTYPNLMYLYNQQDIFEESALLYLDGAVITSLPNDPMRTNTFVSPEWFSLLDKKMHVGRAFDESEAVNSYHAVTVISFKTWQEDFNKADDILEKSVTFSGKSYRIIGVLAQDDLDLHIGYTTEYVLPWDFNFVSEYDRNKWGNDDGGLMFFGKLSTDNSLFSSAEQINQHLTQLVNDNWQEQVSGHEFFKGWGIGITTKPLKSFVVDNNERSVYLLLIGAFGLVLIASANIANLFISRTVERQQQLAIYAALGASRAQLFRTILAEIGLLMFFATLFAQLVVACGFAMLHHGLASNLPRIQELQLNAFSFSISLALMVVFTVIFSLLCRRMVNYRALNHSLQSSGKGTSIQVSQTTRNILIASQIAVATALIFINVVLHQEATEMIDQPLGHQTDDIYAAVLALPNLERKLNSENLMQLKALLNNKPEVLSVSQSMRPSIFGTLAITEAITNKRFSISGKYVDDQYFSTIGQAFIEGDNFTAANIKDQDRVIVINDVFAKMLAPNGSAIGTKFKNGASVIGVVRSINVPGRVEQRPRFYYPAHLGKNMFLIKVKQGQSLSRESLLSAMKSIDSQMSLFSYASLNTYKERRLFSSTTTATTTIVLTLLTIYLSSIGLYGILKYSSQIRRFEIGTRMAIGAKGRDIVSMVIRDNTSALSVGFLVSILILILVYLGFNDTLVAYVKLSSLYVFVIIVALIALLSSIACYVPLREYIRRPVVQALKGSE